MNFITNIVLFLAGVSMLLESRGYKVKVIVRKFFGRFWQRVNMP